MTTPSGNDSLDAYAASLAQFEAAIAKRQLKADAVLNLLLAREQVQRSQSQAGGELSSKQVRDLIELDERLRTQAGRMLRVVPEAKLARWRGTVGPEEKAWWWWLERVEHPRNQLDGLWKLVTIAGWTANITLMVNLAARLLGGGVGLFGVAAGAVPRVLGLLQIGTEFTKAGAEGFDRVLGKLRIPQHWRVEVKLALTLVISGLLLGLWLQLPALSVAENGWAMKHYSAGKLGDAEQGFLKAIALDGDNAEAHYNLGALYEDLEQQDKAKKEYLIAIAGGIPDAYNNLARLYLKEKKYAEAAALLNRGMGESAGKSEGAEDPPLRAYNLRKNLGWVRLEQKQYDDAKDWLTQAIALSERPEAVKVGVNPSSAHCLLAQVLERQKQGAIAAWRQCQDLATGMNPDEDAWLYEAQQKLGQASMKSK